MECDRGQQQTRRTAAETVSSVGTLVDTRVDPASVASALGPRTVWVAGGSGPRRQPNISARDRCHRAGCSIRGQQVRARQPCCLLTFDVDCARPLPPARTTGTRSARDRQLLAYADWSSMRPLPSNSAASDSSPMRSRQAGGEDVEGDRPLHRARRPLSWAPCSSPCGSSVVARGIGRAIFASRMAGTSTRVTWTFWPRKGSSCSVDRSAETVRSCTPSPLRRRMTSASDWPGTTGTKTGCFVSRRLSRGPSSWMGVTRNPRR